MPLLHGFFRSTQETIAKLTRGIRCPSRHQPGILSRILNQKHQEIHVSNQTPTLDCSDSKLSESWRYMYFPFELRCGRGYLRNVKLSVRSSQEWRLNGKDTNDPNNQQPRCIHIRNLYIYIYVYKYIHTWYTNLYQSEPEWSYSTDMMTSQKELLTSWGDGWAKCNDHVEDPKNYIKRSQWDPPWIWSYSTCKVL